MKTLFFLFAAFLLFSCMGQPEPKVFALKYPEKEKGPATLPISPADTLNYDCTRSIPEPVLDSTHFVNWYFNLEKLKEDNTLQGIEYALLKNGNEVLITNSGCEYYSLLFEFTSKQHSEKTTNLAYWAKRTVSLLKEIKPHCDAPVDWETLEKKLLTYYKEGSKSILNQELVINDSEIGTVAYLEKVEQLEKGMVKISLRYSVGPL